MSKRGDRENQRNMDRHQRAAKRAINSITEFGKPRHGNKDDGKVKSFGTARSYRQTYNLLSKFLATNKIGRLHNLTPERAETYLQHRSSKIQQTQLSNERRALTLYLREKNKNSSLELDRFKSTRESPSNGPRAYSREQVQHIIKHSDDRQKLSTAVAYRSGARCIELLTLSPAAERPVTHRADELRPDRFTGGREHWITYSVIGKGGRPREVKIPPELAQKLEQARLDKPITRTDRGIRYTQRYNINGGKVFSENFTDASYCAIGYSTGAHGLRHSYVQERMLELMKSGKSEEDSKYIVAQEIGHESIATMVYYLR